MLRSSQCDVQLLYNASFRCCLAFGEAVPERSEGQARDLHSKAPEESLPSYGYGDFSVAGFPASSFEMTWMRIKKNLRIG